MMLNNQKVEELTNKVLQSKKYRSIYRPTIERITADVLQHYLEKDAEKIIKRKLHQIWGAYFTRPNFNKLIDKIDQKLKSGEDIKAIVLPLLQLQTSTCERIPVLDSFYQQIFKVTGTRIIAMLPTMSNVLYILFS